MSSILSLFDLKGKNAIVTGASRGLGEAAAKALAMAGANVALVGRDLDTLKEVEGQLKKFDVDTLRVRCDVSKPRQVGTVISRTQRKFGGIDILINNAGIITRWPATAYPLEEWKKVLDVNLTGQFNMAQGVGRVMLERGGGKIINIASLLSFSGGSMVPAYTASKHGVAGLTKALANEWAAKGVNVNAIAPGYFETDATKALRKNKKRFKELSGRIPAGRWGKPEDLHGALLFLASEASNYVHGHILTVDGGWMAG